MSSTPSLLDQAKEFHGHLGPYVVLGLRMGHRAVELLGGQRHFRIRAVVRCPDQPPPSCLLDGLQLTTGCTMGKRNIELISDREIVVIVHAEDPSRQVVLRPITETMSRAQEIMAKQSDEEAARWLWELPEDQVFTFALEQRNAHP